MTVHRRSRHRNSNLLRVLLGKHRARRWRLQHKLQRVEATVDPTTVILGVDPEPTVIPGVDVTDPSALNDPLSLNQAIFVEGAPSEQDEPLVMPAVFRTHSMGTFQYNEYMIIEGDRLDRIAGRYYGDPNQWWRIADANPKELFDPENLVPGTFIKIPNDTPVRFL